MKWKSVAGLILCIIVIAGLLYTAAFGFTVQGPISGNEYKFPSVMDKEDGIKKKEDEDEEDNSSNILIESDSENNKSISLSLSISSLNS